MSEYSQGVCEDGAAILCNGEPITIEEILQRLRQRDELLAAITLARDMFIANGLDINLRNTFETMQDAIAKVQS